VGGSFERLAWDSELFGFSVARILDASLRESDLARVLRNLRDAGAVLAYWSVGASDHESATAAGNHGGLHVDTKVTYGLRIAPGDDTCDPTAGASVVDYAAREASPELERLALQSGAFSRFRTDPNVPRAVFERLYRIWIQRSAAREIADRILVVSEPRETLGGFLTLRFEGETCTLGLLAVEPGSRGHGYGRLLLRAAHDLCRSRGYSRASLVTQAANAPACRLFEAAGYGIEQRELVFHFWLTPRSGDE
jgi:dTDP-4-amino-4,6-dideoxy-D-galactose acyltransferase